MSKTRSTLPHQSLEKKPDVIQLQSSASAVIVDSAAIPNTTALLTLENLRTDRKSKSALVRRNQDSKSQEQKIIKETPEHHDRLFVYPNGLYALTYHSSSKIVLSLLWSLPEMKAIENVMNTASIFNTTISNCRFQIEITPTVAGYQLTIIDAAFIDDNMSYTTDTHHLPYTPTCMVSTQKNNEFFIGSVEGCQRWQVLDEKAHLVETFGKQNASAVSAVTALLDQQVVITGYNNGQLRTFCLSAPDQKQAAIQNGLLHTPSMTHSVNQLLEISGYPYVFMIAGTRAYWIEIADLNTPHVVYETTLKHDYSNTKSQCSITSDLRIITPKGETIDATIGMKHHLTMVKAMTQNVHSNISDISAITLSYLFKPTEQKISSVVIEEVSTTTMKP